MSLTSIANFLQCDKGTAAFERHGYTEIYQQQLATCKRLIEIGIDKGLSLEMWRRWRPKMVVTAMDIIEEIIEREKQNGFDARLCDQSNESSLRQFATSIGESVVDAIIDDGSHRPDDQLLTLQELWPTMKPGGKYFIEDLHTSNWFPVSNRAPARLREFAKHQNALITFLCKNKLAVIVKP